MSSLLKLYQNFIFNIIPKNSFVLKQNYPILAQLNFKGQNMSTCYCNLTKTYIALPRKLKISYPIPGVRAFM